MTPDDLVFDDIYPPAALLRIWGWQSAKEPNPSDYMRHHIAEWCACKGALRMFNAMRNVDSSPAPGANPYLAEGAKP